MTQKQQDNFECLLAFLAGAIVAAMIERVLNSRNKAGGLTLFSAAAGGCVGIWIYQNHKRKNRNNGQEFNVPENLIAYNGDPREFFKTKLFKRIIFDNVTGYKICKVGKNSLPYCNEADLQSTSNLFYCRFFDIETYENCLNDLFNNEATFRVYNPEYSEDGWQLASERVKNDLAAVTTTHRVNSPFTIASFINTDEPEIVDFYEVDLREMIEWRNKNWAASSSIITLSKIYKRKFAADSLKNGFLDLARYYELDGNYLYRITYENQDNYLTPGKILFNAEELRYFSYGYISARMNLTYYEALFAAVNFFGKENFSDCNNLKYSEMPWLISAFYYGYYYFYNQKRAVEPLKINHYEPYNFNNEKVIDLDWDLGDFAIDTVLTLGCFNVLKAGYSVAQISTKMTVGMLVDVIIQIELNKLDGTSTEDAISAVNWSDAFYSGVEILHSKWLTSSLIAMLRTALKDVPYIRCTEDVKEIVIKCGKTFVYNLLANFVVEKNDRLSKIIRKCLRNNASETINGLWALGLDKDTVEWIVARSLNGIDTEITELIEKKYERQ